MPLRTDWSERLCPVDRALDVLGDPWVLMILRDVMHGRTRFEELKEGLGISDPVLVRRLGDLVEAGLLEKRPYEGDGRTRHVYVVTPAGADALPILNSLALWGEKHTSMPAGSAHMALIHDACGQESASADVCTTCGEPLRAGEMSWDEPWKGRRIHLVGATP